LKSVFPYLTNSQSWRWIIVEDADKRAKLAELYRVAGVDYLAGEKKNAESSGDKQTKRVLDSAVFLSENLQHAPMHVIPCMQGRPPEGAPLLAVAAMLGSIFPAVWSFQLALRARGLGSCLTSLHLACEKEAAELLGIPDDVMQIALLPVAYTKGTDFKRASRPPASPIMQWDSWGD
jgi:nitroreductase